MMNSKFITVPMDEEAIKAYSTFLTKDDYKMYQPWIALKKGTYKHLKCSQAAMRNHVRSIWILNRLTQFASHEWAIWESQFSIAAKSLSILDSVIKQVEDLIKSGVKINDDTDISTFKDIYMPYDRISYVY